MAVLYGTLQYKVTTHRCDTSFASHARATVFVCFKVMGHLLCSVVQGGRNLVSIIMFLKTKKPITWRVQHNSQLAESGPEVIKTFHAQLN